MKYIECTIVTYAQIILDNAKQHIYNSHMNCSINQIAEYLGISRNTVSKAINGKPGVSEETRKKILATASEMKYRQYILEYSEKEKEVKHLGSIIFLTKASSQSGFWLKVMDGINKGLEGSGYTLVLGIITEDEILQGKLPTILNDKSIKGIILVEVCNAAICTKIVNLGFPVVTVDMPPAENEINKIMDVITMENKENIKKLIRHLYDKGKRRFSFAGNLNSFNVSDGIIKRYEAFTETLSALALEEEKAYSFTKETQEQFSNNNYLVQKIRGMKNPPEVYICGNDSTALQLMHAFTFCGYSIPRDIAFAGFDDIPDASDSLPPLTTIRIPKELLGECTAFAILSKIKDPARPRLFMEANTELILRDST